MSEDSWRKWVRLEALWRARDERYRDRRTYGFDERTAAAVRVWRVTEAEALDEPERDDAIDAANAWVPPQVVR